jgi:hypothetical protein
LLTQPELDALVAPIALYPDPLITNILMAATYPLEVVQADRWLKGDGAKLQGDALQAAVQEQSWDDSVKALGATPTVLEMMSSKLDWTQKLGDAVLAQQTDVMDSIQRLRGKAYDKKTLSSNEAQSITVSQDQGRQTIAIAPASPETISVPYYDPAVAFGEWPYSDYPAYPYYWPAPSYIGAGVLASGLVFGAGYAVGRWGNNYWGNNINWRDNDININRGARVEHWQHNPQHRGGVRYNNAAVQQRFGGADRAGLGGGNRNGLGGAGAAAIGGAAGAAALGRAGQTRGQGPGDRAGAGDRGKGAAAANRGGNKKAAANGGNRQTAANRGGNRKSAAGGPKHGGSRNAAAGGNRGANVANRGAGGARPANVGAGARGSFASANVGRANVGGARMGGGGGARMGGGGGRGGRRSDIRLKHDIVLLGHLDNGLGLYRFAYKGSETPYVGVMAQEVERVRPDAVLRGRDGYLRVRYDRLGLTFQTYDHWRAGGTRAAMGQ